MNPTPARDIVPANPAPQMVAVPGSKSSTHRMLIAAALSIGTCRIHNPLNAEDTQLTRRALVQMGAVITGNDPLLVAGVSGRPGPCETPIYLGNSGTSMRLLTAIAALGSGEYELTGLPRMTERPIQDLLDGLVQIGIPARSLKGNGCPPIRILGGHTEGGRVHLRCTESSQYLSAMMMMAPCTARGCELRVSEGPVSRPYIDLTVDVLRQFGITVEQKGYERFVIAGAQHYGTGVYHVEPDSSQAGYFWAMAAVCGTRIGVRGVSRRSRQGDTGLCNILGKMGCRVSEDADGLTVEGGPLVGVTVDMSGMPDMVPTLAVVAAYARGITEIRNVAHLKIKESDRLTAVATELQRMGIRVDTMDDGLRVHGGTPHGADIRTYDDHRMAMSFAVAGLRTPGVRILDPGCVKKSFPTFWDVLETLYG